MAVVAVGAGGEARWAGAGGEAVACVSGEEYLQACITSKTLVQVCQLTRGAKGPTGPVLHRVCVCKPFRQTGNAQVHPCVKGCTGQLAPYPEYGLNFPAHGMGFLNPPTNHKCRFQEVVYRYKFSTS